MKDIELMLLFIVKNVRDSFHEMIIKPKSRDQFACAQNPLNRS
jgi:hypothetical protein